MPTPRLRKSVAGPAPSPTLPCPFLPDREVSRVALGTTICWKLRTRACLVVAQCGLWSQTETDHGSATGSQLITDFRFLVSKMGSIAAQEGGEDEMSSCMKSVWSSSQDLVTASPR